MQTLQQSATSTGTPQIDKSKIDVARAFLAFASFAGDLEKTAYACNLPVETIQYLAADENWSAKISAAVAARSKGKGDDFEKNINRTINYVQAHRLRELVDKVLVRVTESKESLDEFLTETKVGRDGVTENFCGKGLVDLAKAMEIAQTLTYRALGDVPTDREEPGKEKNNALKGIGLDVMKALNNVPESAGLSTVALVKESLEAETRKQLE